MSRLNNGGMSAIRTSGNSHLEVEVIHRKDVVAHMAYLSEDDALHGVVDSSACIGPSRSTLPSVTCMRTLIFTSLKSVMLNEVHKFKEIDGDDGLSDKQREWQPQ